MSEENKKESLDKAKESLDKARDATKESLDKAKDATKELAASLGSAFMAGSPRERARNSGKYLAGLGISWGILSIIGAIIIAFQSSCSEVSEYSDSCLEKTYPNVDWAVGSIFVNVIVASFLYAVGTYIEARMSEESSN